MEPSGGGKRRKGARLLLGGTVPNHPGAYYAPTVLTDVNKGMPAYEEELFARLRQSFRPEAG